MAVSAGMCARMEGGDEISGRMLAGFLGTRGKHLRPVSDGVRGELYQ